MRAGIQTMLLRVSAEPLQRIQWIGAYVKTEGCLKLITTADEDFNDKSFYYLKHVHESICEKEKPHQFIWH